MIENENENSQGRSSQSLQRRPQRTQMAEFRRHASTTCGTLVDGIASAVIALLPADSAIRTSTYTGDQPALLWCTSSPCNANIVGTDGPHISRSKRPTSWPSAARHCANCADTVLFPTPPFPLSTNTIRRTPAMRLFIAARSGSVSAVGATGGAPDAHAR